MGTAVVLEKSDAPFQTVYGPVRSWRYGTSLGIDPIGPVSTCSFDCVYCQLGEIEQWVGDRRLFIPTERILADLAPFAPWNVDVITLSGSGEPTMALNLESILRGVQELTGRPTVVLTNGTLLGNADVQQALNWASQVAIKIDAVDADLWQRINRPVNGMTLDQIWQGIQQFRAHYSGRVGVQTMLLSPWREADQRTYIDWMQALRPDEIQLNTPTRPKPLKHELDARGNHSAEDREYAVRRLTAVSPEVLQGMGDRIHQTTGIPVRWPHRNPLDSSNP